MSYRDRDKNKTKNKRPKGFKPIKTKITRTRPLLGKRNKSMKVFLVDRRRLRYVALGLLVIFTIGFAVYSFNSKDKPEKDMTLDQEKQDNIIGNTPVDKPAVEEDEEKPEKEPEEIAIPTIDMSDSSSPLQTSMQRINEPIPYGREILYSAGNSENIDEPIFQELYILDLDTGQERAIAETGIKFGEIYEGRFNENWISWLDTNQSGDNQLYFQDRSSGEITKIKSSEFNKPQLRLGGDNLVWLEQRDLNQDVLYLYNFKSGEPIVLEVFNNPTYGTCPPSLSKDTLVWATPDNDDSGDTHSFIKRLNLSSSLIPDQEDVDININKDGDKVEVEGETPTIEPDEGADPEIIDPKGFAIYPITNGDAVAWLDNLDPLKANLNFTLDNGETITHVAEGVGRPYGIGDGFIAYMKDDVVMAYFWELERYAQLNKPGTKARLTQGGVWGNKVVWYSADNPNEQNDNLMVSIVEEPIEE